ncbi:hypothetical protein [Pseudomonas sp. TCU-HL1]|uniref:hypothetical protein n=1 Tax=Pseudomonas sp. TCU-HL1 TaxID=1856685 RepID=UPI00083E1B07|nr:hypothetical protein [Pseudomonas sp. TCU-HL1]AOE86129.1 hypothetical protein THL1_3581 [Pseudomonas sp. TCU-HL1]
MDRSYVYKQFIGRYPDAKEHAFEAGKDRSCSVMVGLFYGVVEVVFVGVYLPDGRLKSEHLYFENDLCNALGVIRVDPEDALSFGKQRATTTCLTGHI